MKRCEPKQHPAEGWLAVISCRSRGIAWVCFTGGISGCPERGGQAEGFLDVLKEVGMPRLGNCLSKGQSSTSPRTGILLRGAFSEAQQWWLCQDGHRRRSTPCLIFIPKRDSPQKRSFASHGKDSARFSLPFSPSCVE